MSTRLTRWEVRFLRPDHSGHTIATYRIHALSKPHAHRQGWAYFNRDHPGFAFGVYVQSYELK